MNVNDIDTELYNLALLEIPSLSPDLLLDVETKVYNLQKMLEQFDKTEKIEYLLRLCTDFHSLIHGCREKISRGSSDIIKSVSSWAADPKPMDKEVRRQILNVLDNQNMRVNVYMASMAQTYVKRLTNLTRIEQKLEGKLFEEDRIDDADTDTLMNMLKIANKTSESTINFLKDLVAAGSSFSTSVLSEQLEEGNLSKIETEESYRRERLRNLFTKILDDLNDNESNKK